MTPSHAFQDFELSGKCALVTGGGTGIGYNITRALARAGARVMICSRRHDVLKAAAEQLQADPLIKEVSYQTVDLADRASVARLIDHANGAFGGVDIFVGNAALTCLELLEQIKDESIDAMLAANLAANIHLVRGFAPHMRTKRWGRIVLISSLTSLTASPHEGHSVYSAVKGGLNSFVRAIAVETGRDGITANTLVLGPFLTDITRDNFALLDRQYGAGAGAAMMDDFCTMTAVGYMADCHEIEGIVQLLASNAGRYITGTNIPVDGGMGIVLRPFAKPSAAAGS